MQGQHTLLAKVAVLTAVMAFVLIGAFSLPHFAMNMPTDMDGTMTMEDCYMPGMTAICSMTPLQHLSEWQQMFTTTVQQNAASVLLLLLALSVVVSQFLLWRVVPKPEWSTSRIRYRYREKPFAPLQLALARGIIHSKAF